MRFKLKITQLPNGVVYESKPREFESMEAARIEWHYIFYAFSAGVDITLTKMYREDKEVFLAISSKQVQHYAPSIEEV